MKSFSLPDSTFSILFSENHPFRFLVGLWFGLQFLPSALVCSHSLASIVLNIIKILFLQKYFFCFVYLFTIYKHQSIYYVYVYA